MIIQHADDDLQRWRRAKILEALRIAGAPVVAREPGEVAMTSPAPTAAAGCAASFDHAFHNAIPTASEEHNLGL